MAGEKTPLWPTGANQKGEETFSEDPKTKEDLEKMKKELKKNDKAEKDAKKKKKNEEKAEEKKEKEERKRKKQEEEAKKNKEQEQQATAEKKPTPASGDWPGYSFAPVESFGYMTSSVGNGLHGLFSLLDGKWWASIFENGIISKPVDGLIDIVTPKEHKGIAKAIDDTLYKLNPFNYFT